MNQIIQFVHARWRGLIQALGFNRLDRQTLEKEICRKLLPGTLKSDVIKFVQTMEPFECNDEGSQVVARWLVETGDLVRSWDIVMVFIFDNDGRLLCYSQTVRDFVDYNFTALRRH